MGISIIVTSGDSGNQNAVVPFTVHVCEDALALQRVRTGDAPTACDLLQFWQGEPVKDCGAEAQNPGQASLLSVK